MTGGRLLYRIWPRGVCGFLIENRTGPNIIMNTSESGAALGIADVPSAWVVGRLTGDPSVSFGRNSPRIARKQMSFLETVQD